MTAAATHTVRLFGPQARLAERDSVALTLPDHALNFLQ